MKFSQLRNVFSPVLLIVLLLVNPAWLMASTDGNTAVEKLQQLRTSQNEHTSLANIKANSIEVGKKQLETPGLAFRQALQANQHRETPEISFSRAPGFHKITSGANAVTGFTLNAMPDPIYHGQGKITYASLDSLYFNFLTSMNGPDTTDMDIVLTIGLGMMFGNDGSFENDSSLIHFYSPSGVLDDVIAVPTIDDPMAIWTSMSDSVNVGNLWVIYTRTSQLYAVLQVTSVSEDYPDEHIAFDYMIQTNGSNIFGDVPPLAITVNNLAADTLIIGSEPYVSMSLGQDVTGTLVVSWDRNHNGIKDEPDIPVKEYEFTDNDMHDLNFDDGIFDLIYENDMADGVNYVTDDFLFTVSTDHGEASASVHFYNNPSPYYVTGTVRDIVSNEPLEGIVVWGDYAMYDMGPMPMEDNRPTMSAITDISGAYTLFFPDSGYVMVGSWDHLMLAGGLIPEPKRVELGLYAGETVNFYYREPLARIRGFVEDESGTPLVDIEMRAFQQDPMRSDRSEGDDGSEYLGFTDETGYYEIGVDPGWFYVEVEGKDLIPDFMIPQGQGLEVTETSANSADFVLSVPNSSISGTVFLDGTPYPDALVHAWNWEFGWNMVWTDEFGAYDIPVYDPVTITFVDSFGYGGYDLRVHLEDIVSPNPIIQFSDNWNVAPGSDNEDILLVTVTGGISGIFYNREDNQPISDSWNVGMQAQNLDNGMSFWTNPSEYDGSYELWLLAGTYEITAGGMDWYGPEPDTILVGETMLPYDIYLDPVNYQGIFDGRVLDDLTNAPIANANVDIGNEYWANHVMTDAEGYFHFELPNGHYGYKIYAPNYLDFFGEVDINDNYVYQETKLKKMIVNGAIGGVVLDGSAPVENAMVDIWNPATAFGFHTWTDADGHYWFDLPNGIYDIHVEHPNYLPYWDSGLWVSNDTLVYDVNLTVADGAIKGHVYDQNDGIPVKYAGIYVVSMNPDPTDSEFFPHYGGMTDDNGDFYIPVRNGMYDVHIDAPGYEPGVYTLIGVDFNEVSLDVPMMMREFMGPIIYSIRDQENDQGRWVRLEFGSETNDVSQYMAYSVWRLTHTPMGRFYDFIAYVPNKDWQFYSLVAPTLIDSNASTSPMEYETEFMVTGHYDEWNFIDGGPNSGYSKDNIHPGAPGGFVLSDIGSDYKDLMWEPNTDDDFQHYELYRAANGDFEGRSPIARLTENHFRDSGINPEVGHHYMLKAIDANGNASEGAIVITPNTLAAGNDALPAEYGLSQNYPNPFNPTTLIEFALPEASEVSLVIYNLLGQKVRTLVSGSTPAGFLNVVWNGLGDNGKTLSSGTYIYQLKSADMTFTKKMVFMK